MSSQRQYHVHVWFWIDEQRRIKFIEFLSESIALAEEQLVEILLRRLAFLQQAPIIGNPAEGHVALCNVLARIREILSARILFALRERKGEHFYARSHAIVQSSPIAVDLLDDPRCCRPAGNQKDVFARSCPPVPKTLKRRQKTGLRRIHPGHFVYKNDLTPFRHPFQHQLQPMERLQPIA